MYYPVVEGGSILEYDTGGVMSVEHLSAEESNEDLLEHGEEFYNAMEEIEWSKVVFEAETTEDELMVELV